MDKAEEIAREYLKPFDRYYEPEQIKELTQVIELYAQQVSREAYPNTEVGEVVFCGKCGTAI